MRNVLWMCVILIEKHYGEWCEWQWFETNTGRPNVSNIFLLRTFLFNNLLLEYNIY